MKYTKDHNFLFSALSINHMQLKPYMQRIFEIGVGSILINLFGLATPIFSMLVYDKVIGNNIPQTLYALGLGMLILIFLDFLLRIMRAFYIEKIACIKETEIDEKLISRLFTKTSTTHTSTGELVSKYRDLTSNRDLMSSSFVLAITDLPFLILYLFCLSLIGGALVFVPLILGGLLILMSLWFKYPILHFSEKSRLSNAKKLALLAEVSLQLDQIKLSRWRTMFQKRWHQLSEETSINHSNERFWSTVKFTLIADSSLLIWMSTIFVGALMADQNSLSAGSLTACSLLASRATALISSFSLLLERFNMFKRASYDFDELIKSGNKEIDSKKTISVTDSDFLALKQSCQGTFNVINLTVTYPKSTNAILQNINLKINPGEHLGIVGRNGSGKSTLLKCLASVMSGSEGKVVLDSAEINSYPAEWLSQYIVYKPQDSMLYEGSLNFNLRGDGSITTDEAVRTALWVSGVDQMIERGEITLNTMIAPNGANLSGGQRQAVSIARALATDPRILILDEPTVGLDQDSEQIFINRLSQFCVGRSLIVSTHSLPLLKLMQRLVVLQDGHVLADGPREKILVVPS